MFESPQSHSFGIQGKYCCFPWLIEHALSIMFFIDRYAIARLQCLIHVGNGIRYDDISFGVHVPRDTVATNVYELCGAIALGAYAVRHWYPSVIFVV